MASITLGELNGKSTKNKLDKLMNLYETVFLNTFDESILALIDGEVQTLKRDEIKTQLFNLTYSLLGKQMFTPLSVDDAKLLYQVFFDNNDKRFVHTFIDGNILLVYRESLNTIIVNGVTSAALKMQKKVKLAEREYTSKTELASNYMSLLNEVETKKSNEREYANTFVADEAILKHLKTGETFLYNDHKWMVVSPHGFIMRSSVLREVMARGDVFAVKLSEGKLTAWVGTTKVKIHS
jgi:hypothetical protein